MPAGHPFILSTTEGGPAYSGVTINGNKITIDVTPTTPDLYYYCSAHSGMGNEISTVPFGMPADIEDMVGLMKSIYDIKDAADGNQDGNITDMADLKNSLIDAAIEGSGDGSVKGLSELLGNIPKNADLNGANAGDDSIESIVTQEITEGMLEFSNQTPGNPGNKTIDEIFKETIEETIDEIAVHIPEAFSGS